MNEELAIRKCVVCKKEVNVKIRDGYYGPYFTCPKCGSSQKTEREADHKDNQNTG